MRISVITISFNQAAFIQAAVQSVLGQKVEEVEYIVVDPGSSDNSRELIGLFQPGISKVIFEPDRGPADGLNKGFAEATGQIYYYLNSDDIVLPGAFRTVHMLFDQNPDVDIVLGHGFMIDSEGRRLGPIYSSNWTPYRYACGCARAVQQATFFRASAFKRTRGFNPANRTCWDTELLADMAGAGAKIRLTNHYLGGFRIHPASISGSKRMYEIYLSDQQRIKMKILGREPDAKEIIVGIALRLLEYIRYPQRFFMALRRRLFVRAIGVY